MVFISGQKPKNSDIPAFLPNLVFLNVNDTYESLSQKSFDMLKYVYQTYTSDDERQFDWLLKADDDTYVIMENLKLFLSDRCDRVNETYGQTFQMSSWSRYLSGGGGYVMSVEAVRRVGRALSERSASCRFNTGFEDVDVAGCLRSVNVTPGESRDSKGRERFHAISFTSYWDGTSKWIEKYSRYFPKYVRFKLVL